MIDRYFLCGLLACVVVSIAAAFVGEVVGVRYGEFAGNAAACGFMLLLIVGALAWCRYEDARDERKRAANRAEAYLLVMESLDGREPSPFAKGILDGLRSQL